jgi:hypothetical protein
MKMLATGYAFMYLVVYPNLVVGKKNPNDLTTPDLKRPLVKATVNTFKKGISFKNDLFSDGKALATLTSFWTLLNSGTLRGYF